MVYSDLSAHRRVRPGRLTWAFAAGVLFVGLAGCSSAASRSSSGTGSTPAVGGSRSGTVTRIVDGDTIVVKVNGADEKVRLIGINTPETVDPRKPVECFGKEASNRTKQLLPVGTAVTLVSDVEPRDKYNRTLSYVYRSSDNAFVNLALVADGYARMYTFPPNVAHVDEFRAAEKAARSANRGLWSAC
jgi:micrococcal nuclease